MARGKANKTPPSRRRYEEEHPTVTARLTKDEKRQLIQHLKETGRSLPDFIMDALGREQSMVEKRVEALAKKKTPPSVEERVKCLERLMFHVGLHLRDCDWPPACPRCEKGELLVVWGDEVGSTQAKRETPTLKCPGCGYFLDTYNHLDPESLVWDSYASKSASKPKAPSEKRRKKRR